MAHKKGVGSTDNGRDSKSKRLGVKLFGGQAALAGNIIVRQRGTKYHAGENAYLGKDYTIHAAINGVVTFKKHKQDRTFVNVLPADVVPTSAAKRAANDKRESPSSNPATLQGVAPKAATATTAAPAATAKAAKGDDLKIIEGVGPKIEQLFHEAGYTTFESVANADVAALKEILVNAGSRYAMHDPTTWGAQARMAMNGEWEQLKAYQDSLVAGRPDQD